MSLPGGVPPAPVVCGQPTVDRESGSSHRGRCRSLHHSMRTDRYRFVEWSGPKSKKKVYELYDEQADLLEKTNIADRPENAELVAKLAAQLHAGGKD